MEADVARVGPGLRAGAIGVHSSRCGPSVHGDGGVCYDETVVFYVGITMLGLSSVLRMRMLERSGDC